jgi:alpha-ketoglutarate-dependent taurine dioxygenase
MLRGSQLVPGERMPLLVRPVAGNRDLGDVMQAQRRELQGRLIEHGALLFRGFDVRSVEDFTRFVDSTALERIDYLYRSTPRSAVGERIFTATEYPPTQEIALHNENAYQRDWPLKVAFCCLICAVSGGATPLGDMRRITTTIGSELVERFETRCVRYSRHYRRHVDLPWQAVFQTEEPAQVAEYCRANAIEHEWLDSETLRTTQVAQGTAVHPATGERLYFNQAHLFHVSSLGEAAAQSLGKLFGPERLPRHASYGTGEEIAPQDLDTVRKAFNRHLVVFPWQQGDVLLLDNMQVAHGRRPFRGQRKVITALLDAYSNRNGETT